MMGSGYTPSSCLRETNSLGSLWWGSLWSSSLSSMYHAWMTSSLGSCTAWKKRHYELCYQHIVNKSGHLKILCNTKLEKQKDLLFLNVVRTLLLIFGRCKIAGHPFCKKHKLLAKTQVLATKCPEPVPKCLQAFDKCTPETQRVHGI